MIAYKRNAVHPPEIKTECAKGCQKRIKVPETITDPLVREILTLVRDSQRTWASLEAGNGLGTDSVRMWFYRERFSANFSLVQTVVMALGYRLVLEKVEEEEESNAYGPGPGVCNRRPWG